MLGFSEPDNEETRLVFGPTVSLRPVRSTMFGVGLKISTNSFPAELESPI